MAKRYGIAVLFLLAMLASGLCPGRGLAGEPPAAATTATAPADPDAIRPLTDAEKQGAGCLLSAATALGISYATAPSEMIMLVVGGLVVPSSSSILFLSLFGTVAAASCAVGGVVTPVVLGTIDRMSN